MKLQLFFELANFFIFLSTFILFSVNTGHIFSFFIEEKLILRRMVLKECIFGFGNTSFHAKFSDSCEKLPIFAVVFVSLVNCDIT